MKVVIDISPLQTGHKTRGIGIYTRELSQGLRKVDKINSYILTTRPHQVKQVSLIHYPYFDLFFHTLPIQKRTRTVVTIHDVIPLIFPLWFKPGLRGRFHLFLQKLALKKVDAVITDSHNSKTDIVKYLKVPADKIHVVHLAVSSEFTKIPSSRQTQKVRSKYHLPDKYFLYVGDINPHKNLPRLLEAFKNVVNIHPQLNLVLVSRALSRPISEANYIKSQITDLDLTKQVKWLTTVPLDPLKDLVTIYAAAEAYIQPSLYEGFGLPVLEAMTAGTPVVCAAVSSLPEIYNHAVVTIDPHSIHSIASGMNQILQLNKTERQNLIDKAKLQAAKFDWKKTALETIKIYQQAIND